LLRAARRTSPARWKFTANIFAQRLTGTADAV
jgi:hypothetical protein